MRGDVSKTNVVLAYLLVVTASAAAGGLGPGITAAALGFLAFDFLFLPPYNTLVVTDPQDYLSLGVYLLVAVVVSLLVGISERRRMQAERREQETRLLFDLSTSLVAHGSLEDTLNSVVRTVRACSTWRGARSCCQPATASAWPPATANSSTISASGSPPPRPRPRCRPTARPVATSSRAWP